MKYLFLIKKIPLYIQLAKVGFKSFTIYNVSVILNMISSITFFFIQVMIWSSIFANNNNLDVTFTEILTYLFISTIVTNLVASESGSQITRKINNGTIEMDLLRPTSLLSPLYFEQIGKNLFKVLTMIPALLIIIFMFDITFPPNPMLYLFMLITIINGSIIIFYYRSILGLVSFWLIRNPFVEWYFTTVESLFSGSIVPIWFYPLWLATITRFLPFRYFVFEPISVFLGKAPVSDIYTIILMQALWLIIFVIIERIVWKRAYRVLVVQGG